MSNLFFANDVILFAEADVEQETVMNDVLHRFFQASGQKLSFEKSRVYFSKNIQLTQQTKICEALRIAATDELCTYLGMPTFTRRVTRETFNHICEILDRRLAGWKTKYLSLAGRMTLATSTISTLAYYSMQTAKIPQIHL